MTLGPRAKEYHGTDVKNCGDGDCLNGKLIADLRGLLRKLVKETPFTPTETGLDLHISFALIHEMQAAVKSPEDLKDATGEFKSS